MSPFFPFCSFFFFEFSLGITFFSAPPLFFFFFFFFLVPRGRRFLVGLLGTTPIVYGTLFYEEGFWDFLRNLNGSDREGTGLMRGILDRVSFFFVCLFCFYVKFYFRPFFFLWKYTKITRLSSGRGFSNVRSTVGFSCEMGRYILIASC
ncbi:hypothetical protein B0T21DRAFT_13613 [Apiosordaria backusii]|uniref:Uncharacterized protein n=1 Tax=Apiosordaria backusii TaxID=314023 RepID=A0AA40K6M8_9PEZI|nr:hypothetical protein B0T21DRAFT_13613 [Apiosordaria backusii]